MASATNSTTAAPVSIHVEPTYVLGRAVADVVAQHTGLKPEQITAVQIDANHCTVDYAIRVNENEFSHRTRSIDTKTGTKVSDEAWG